MSTRPSAQSFEALPPLERAVEIMRVLRSNAGCPWDREQTLESLQRHTLEEVYEVFDAIQHERWTELQDELGDLFLQVLFYAQIASDRGLFDVHDVAATLSAKLLRRHPHVFGNTVALDAASVVKTWESVKQQERSSRSGLQKGALDEIPRAMPALLEAAKLGSRAAKLGFDWKDTRGVLDKVAEEIREVEQEIRVSDRRRAEEEFGDVLLSLVSLGRHLGIDAEQALRGANGRFRERFAEMERIGSERIEAGTMTSEAWEQLWEEAKKARAGTQ